MRIGIFAAEDIGFETVRYFSQNNKKIVCIVIDSKDTHGVNRKIINEAHCKNVVYSDKLYDTNIITMLKSLDIDMIILAWWPYIIKKELFDITKNGFLNMHPSYLPYNRGKHYYFWNLVENNTYGVTLHFIDKDIDSGDIAFQTIIETTWEDTGNTIRQKGKTSMLELFKKNFEQIVIGNIPRKKQNLEQGTYHWGYEINEASKIDLDKKITGRELINIIRGRSGFPTGGAWFIDNGEKYEMSITIKKV
ncbi:MAG: formyl transferase [Desulfamplus sp.]|nr:formyl transferase [Desulfamplus sp.]